MNQSFNVLIVDDVVNNIQVAMNILHEDNYNQFFATDGEEALALIADEPTKFDLILLDVMMPKINGFEVCKQIKSNPLTADIPVIFVTAKVDIDAISQGFRLGAVDYITKPFHADELLARVKNHLSLAQAKNILKKHNIDLEKKVALSAQRYITEVEETQREMIMMLTEMMEFSSDETGQHIRRISNISALLAYYHPSLDPDDEDTIYNAAPMHDIGKITIPHEILHKPGSLTVEEFNVMKMHTTNAYSLLNRSSRRLFKAAAIIAHQHHERWDGKGYPRGLAEHEIHIYGRVVCLADVLDALTHERCYKAAWSFEEAVDYIIKRRGVQFDPELVDIFLEHLPDFKKLCLA